MSPPQFPGLVPAFPDPLELNVPTGPVLNVVILRPSTVVPVVKTVPEIVAVPTAPVALLRSGPCTPPPEAELPAPPDNVNKLLDVLPLTVVFPPEVAVVLYPPLVPAPLAPALIVRV